MIGRSPCRLRLNAAKAQLGQIKLIDEDIDRPDRIILRQIVFQPLGKQSALTAVIANDKARHRILRPNRRRIISLTVFSHSLGQERKWSGLSGMSVLPPKTRHPQATPTCPFRAIGGPPSLRA